MAVVSAARGREAITHWTLAARYGKTASLLTCRLETGRTHQIRVHLAHIGHPLLGDSVYGNHFKTKASLLDEAPRKALAALGRQALHAAELGFLHPVTGAELYFESPLPLELAQLANALDNQF
jgi:23S rRNA pseudouridine1911/1915/1917 synthase